MCTTFQISGNCLLLTMHFKNSTKSFKQNCKTKINMLGDIPSNEFVPDLHLLNLLKTLHCETRISDKYLPGKLLSLGTLTGSLSISYADAKNSLKPHRLQNQSINWYFCMKFS